jgi:large subunit ribosomal protein L22
MKGYSFTEEDKNCARTRVEGAEASYKDLTQVCNSIKGMQVEVAVSYLQLAAEGEIPVLYRRHNRNLGHRRELGGQKGRYPHKAARIVLNALKSAMANGRDLKNLSVLCASANKKQSYGRLASKGRWARANLETSRIEIVLRGEPAPKSEAKPREKKEEKVSAKTETSKSETEKPKSAEIPVSKHETSKPVTSVAKSTAPVSKKPNAAPTHADQKQKKGG